VKERISAGPVLETDGVVRWRLRDIQRVIEEEHQVTCKPSGVGMLVRAMGFAHLSTRPSHPQKDEAAMEDFKKNSPTG
jgi:transposase